MDTTPQRVPAGIKGRHLVAWVAATSITVVGCATATPDAAVEAPSAPTEVVTERTDNPTSSPGTSANTTDDPTDPGPSARIYHPMVSDGERLYVFGGLTRHGWGPGLTDAWAYTPADATWEPLGAPEPGEVGHPAYDAESDRFIMLDFDGETWAYDPGADAWEHRKPSKSPSARCGERTVYDSQSDRVVLYGGFACTGPSDPGLDDTWTYDYNSDTWQQMTPDRSPPGRMFHGMVYDAASDRTVVWGGRVDDTRVWTYDADDDRWMSPSVSGGPQELRSYHAMSYDPVQEQVLVFGGLEVSRPDAMTGTLRGDLWAYDVSRQRWQEIAVKNGPQPRALHQMAFDHVTGTHVIFGGEISSAYSNDLTNEVWAFDPINDEWLSPANQSPRSP